MRPDSAIPEPAMTTIDVETALSALDSDTSRV
jgi:hypothetical protein